LPDRFEPNNTPTTATWLGRVSYATISGVNLTSGSDVDYFVFQTARTGAFRISAPGVLIQVLTVRGRLLSGGLNMVSLPPVHAGTTLLVRVLPPASAAVPSYTLSISPAARIAAGRKFANPRRQKIPPSANLSGVIAEHKSPDRSRAASLPVVTFQTAGPTVRLDRRQPGRA
jgi:hypothetical protein